MRRSLMNRPPLSATSRRGVFLVVSALCLAAVMTFVAFSVDLGIISLTRTQMQSATDTAALAAAMEITDAISNAGEDVSDVFEYAKVQATAEAVAVAELNGVYVNSGTDVVFGRRYESGGEYFIDWNASSSQINVVKVTARRDSTDKNAQDAKVPGLFSKAFGSQGTTVRTESIAYIEPRDIVVVHDFSRSMNFDSYFATEATTTLTQEQIESNISLVWEDLDLTLGTFSYTPAYAAQTKSNTGASATVTYKGKSVSVTTNTKIKTVKIYFETGSSQTFSISGESTTSGTWSGTGSNSNKRISSADITIRKVGSTSASWTLSGYSYDTSAFQNTFGLSSVAYPYASGSWSDYVSFVKTNSGLSDHGYQDKYGGLTLVCYLLKNKSSYSETEDLWKTRHYPFHAIKEGHEMLCDFLSDLGFDDHLGMVSYDTNHRIETTISDSNPEFPSVNISSNPLTNDYDAVNKLMKYKQASHYSDSTNMAGGIKDGISLIDQYKRTGSRPAIILMTDGNGNVLDSGESGSLPGGWNWAELFDYDGNGSADYTTSNTHAKCVLKYVKEAVDKGYTVHAISVGADADRDLLEAVAWLGGGYWIDIPGGQTATDMESDLKEAFTKIAAAVPPARLVKSED